MAFRSKYIDKLLINRSLTDIVVKLYNTLDILTIMVFDINL